MQLTLKVTFDDRVETVTTNMMTIVMWERKYKRKASQIADGIGVEDLSYLAYEASRTQGIVVPALLDDYIKQIKNLEVVDSNDPKVRRGSYRYGLAQILVATGFWPTEITFELDDMNTVIEMINKERKAR
jgi:hypothetical protein